MTFNAKVTEMEKVIKKIETCKKIRDERVIYLGKVCDPDGFEGSEFVDINELIDDIRSIETRMDTLKAQLKGMVDRL